ncbi:hypothetical protein EDC56_1702 [Sinobacterium caligoides]|uniref:Uncharacterized protein n=1 Tax=Sinobacterium caligoides TaxID=933926 RepID=A0A3N2DN92_9GAMM|nr:hypothetical protein EDC56_1702 [Sinobacterium caligoides]
MQYNKFYTEVRHKTTIIKQKRQSKNPLESILRTKNSPISDISYSALGVYCLNSDFQEAPQLVKFFYAAEKDIPPATKSG